MNEHLSRRAFVKASVASLSAGLFLSKQSEAFALKPLENTEFILDALPIGDAFPLGIASGDPTASDVILWTQHTRQNPLLLKVFEIRKGKRVAEVLSQLVSKKQTEYIYADIGNLTPKTRYEYVFIGCKNNLEPVYKSPSGYFKTAEHPDDLSLVRLGAVSCTYNLFEPVVLEHAGARTDLDAFLFLGDTSYNDGCFSLADFRDQWASNLGKKGYLDVRASTSVIATIDDHEVSNNFNPEEISPELLSLAKKTFFEHLPIRRSSANPDRIWRSLHFGRTLDLFVLDCRTERKPSTQNTKHGQYISREQMDWLKEGLSTSKAHFKAIANTVPIGDIPWADKEDRWTAYPNQRNEILLHIDKNRIQGVLWISGDFHYGAYGQVSKRGAGRNQKEVLVGPGAQIPNWEAVRLMVSSQYEWATMRNNYVVMDFDPSKDRIDVHYHAGSDDPKEPSSSIELVHSTNISFEK